MSRDLPQSCADIDLDVLGDSITFYVRSMDVAVSRDLETRLRGLEVAKGKGKIIKLLLIGRYPGVRPSTLADWVMTDRAQVARIVERFVADGLVDRRTAENDNRAAELYLTERGHALVTKLRGIIAQQEADFFREMISPEDHDTVVRILRSMYVKLIDRRSGA